VLSQTAHCMSYVEHCRRVVEDHDREKRLEKQECVHCFHSGHVGGSMSCRVLCGLCGKEMLFMSTCFDVLCPECAREHNLCKHCGADINLKKRRKL
jgi:hypothetical protein